MSSNIPFTTQSNADISKCFKWRKSGTNKIYWWVISGKCLQDKYQKYNFISEDCKTKCAKTWKLVHTVKSMTPSTFECKFVLFKFTCVKSEICMAVTLNIWHRRMLWTSVHVCYGWILQCAAWSTIHGTNFMRAMNSKCQIREICNQCLHAFQLHTTLCSLACTSDVVETVTSDTETWLKLRDREWDLKARDRDLTFLWW